MQIDWIIVAAQVVNFLILVWLLNRVLFRPLMRAMNERAEAVRQQLAQTEAAQARAQAAEADHRAAIRALEAVREDRLAAIETEAQTLHEILTREARAEIAAHRTAWGRQLEEEKSAFLDRLRQRAGEAFVTLARHALAEMSDSDLVDQIARVFVRRLAGLDPEERARLAALAAAGERVEILSTFDLSPPTRALVAEDLARILDLGDAFQPVFRAEPDLECGVLLTVGSRHVGWTLGEHLDAFEGDIAQLLSEQVRREIPA